MNAADDRCFLLLFPSHQTWYLVLVFVGLVYVCLEFTLVLIHSAFELFSILVLNLGLPVLKPYTGFQLFSDTLLQSLSVRAAGFGIISVPSMAPSVL